MHIVKVSDQDNRAKSLWEHNMCEPWSIYDGADRFVMVDGDEVVGGFAVYNDESDGIEGTFCSGWAVRHNRAPVIPCIRQIAKNYGDLLFKTDRRPAKILLEKIGERIKTTDRFCYYKVKDI